MTALLTINRIHYPVTVLGPGTRVGIWVQGCDIGCRGCASRDTWERSGGSTTSVAELVAAVVRLVGTGQCDGVTLSGGEPFDQAAALAELVPALRSALAPRATDGELDVLVYTGRTRRAIEASHANLLDLIDVFIPEPYVAAAGAGDRGRGSANQPLVTVSDLGRRRFDPWVRDKTGSGEVQLAIDEDGIWMIGLPRPDDLHRLDDMMARRGVVLGERSWRP